MKQNSTEACVAFLKSTYPSIKGWKRRDKSTCDTGVSRSFQSGKNVVIVFFSFATNDYSILNEDTPDIPLLKLHKNCKENVDYRDYAGHYVFGIDKFENNELQFTLAPELEDGGVSDQYYSDPLIESVLAEHKDYTEFGASESTHLMQIPPGLVFNDASLRKFIEGLLTTMRRAGITIDDEFSPSDAKFTQPSQAEETDAPASNSLRFQKHKHPELVEMFVKRNQRCCHPMVGCETEMNGANVTIAFYNFECGPFHSLNRKEKLKEFTLPYSEVEEAEQQSFKHRNF